MGYKRQALVDNQGRYYESISQACRELGISKCHAVNGLKENKGFYRMQNGITLRMVETEDKTIEPLKDTGIQVDASEIGNYSPDEVAEFLAAKKIEDLPYSKFDFALRNIDPGTRYAVALFSDAHIEETVRPDSVLGLNEYNLDIARRRVESYFNHLALCLNEDKVDDLIFASLGDTISGYIHDELAQTNGLSPLEAIYEAQNLLVNGLRFLYENTDLRSIKFIGICGNHSRSTKKIQHSNGYRMSYEWLMYKNVEKICKMMNLPITFCIPESELAIVTTMDRRTFIFMHGFQIKSSGNSTVCGIYPALNRLTMKYRGVFNQDRVYLGHFHSCVSIPNAVVNGSIIGYTAYSMSNGFSNEEPAQMYQLFGTGLGEMLTRKIYCD